MTDAFVIDTHDLDRRPGTMRTLALEVPAPHRLGNEIIAIGEGDPVEIDVRLEAVMEGVLVTGSADATATGICGRCLRPITHDVSVDVNELFAYPERAAVAAGEADEAGETLPALDGDSLDLEATLTDALVPALPFQPLCRPDCPGLCQVCGIPLDEAEPGHAHEAPIDPRWAALAGLTDATLPDEERDEPEEREG